MLETIKKPPAGRSPSANVIRNFCEKLVRFGSNTFGRALYRASGNNLGRGSISTNKPLDRLFCNPEYRKVVFFGDIIGMFAYISI